MDFGGLDLKAGPIVASFFGAMAYAVVLKTKDPRTLASIVFVGMATSIFIGPLVADQILRLGFSGVSSDGLQNATGFITGLSGMVICNGCIALAKKFFSKKESV